MGDTCPFCRSPTPARSDPDSDEATLALVQKRADAGDPAATEFLASAYDDGNCGLQQDVPRAIELWTEAARLGDLDAHYKLGDMFCYGDGVDQDDEKAIRHWQQAAIQGHPSSRFMLGCREYIHGNHGLAAQHYLISAKMGHEKSLQKIKAVFMKGHATKVQYAEALKGYQSASEGTKSFQREEALDEGE